MKKRIPTRLLSAFLAVVIVFLMIPFSTTIVYADSVEVDSTIEKYRLDAINGASSQILFEYIADSFNTESVEGSFHKTTTQKNLSTINKGLKIADSGMKLLSLVPGVNVVSKPFGDVLSGIEGITGEFIENDANAQLMDQMNAISVQVSELSKQKIEAIYVYAHQGYNVSNANWLNVHVGAVCGQNSGTVSGTEVLNSKITGKADTEKDNSPGKIVVRVGGIVGDHIGGAIKNVYSHDNVLTGYAYSVDKDDVFTNWNEGEAWIRIGGLVGQNSGSAAVEQSYVYNNSLEPSGSSDDLNKQTGEVIGYIGGNSPVDCVVSIKPATGYKSDPELTLEFYAYEYIRGERYLKSSSNGSTKYSLQEHRIDTSNLGDTTAIKLIHISENMYKRKNIAITVVAEEPQELCVYALPHKITNV